MPIRIPNLVPIKINNLNLEVVKGLTILQACYIAGFSIPRFCYHEKLSIAGNCRMCLLEVKNAPKLLASCAVPISDNMIIRTDSVRVKKARADMLEFLLSNHPLDCPVCDQGGECDLQDQTIIFGSDRGRFYEYKRVVADKNFGPIIKTVMTRCIHCTRCIRFSHEVGGYSAIGTTGRGSLMEIGTYLDKSLKFELSGNLIDICPVGALTAYPHAFQARAWEMRNVDSIDILDSFGSNICFGVRGNKIMRILPRANEGLNGDWITNKIRFFYDSLHLQRLESPIYARPILSTRTQAGDILFHALHFYGVGYTRPAEVLPLPAPYSWEQAVKETFSELQHYKKGKNFKNFVGMYGKLSSLEALISFKSLLNLTGTANIFSTELTVLNNDFTSGYLFQHSCIEAGSFSQYLLVGTNPRLESPLLNVKLRSAVLSGNTTIAALGSNTNLNFYVKLLGNSTDILIRILEGQHWFCSRISYSDRILFLIGVGFFSSVVVQSFISAFLFISGLVYNNRFFNNKFKFLSSSVSSINSNEIGLFTSRYKVDILYTKKNEVVNHAQISATLYYFLNVDFDDVATFKKNIGDYIIYQGHHTQSNKFSSLINMFLPVTTFVESDSHYCANDGRYQRARFTVLGPSFARTDWQLFGLFYLFFSGSTIFNFFSCNLKRLNLWDLELVTPETFIENNFCANFSKLSRFSFVPSTTNYFLSNQLDKISKINSNAALETNLSIFVNVNYK